MTEYSTLDESRKRKRKQDEIIEEDIVEIDAIDAYNFDPTAIRLLKNATMSRY